MGTYYPSDPNSGVPAVKDMINRILRQRRQYKMRMALAKLEEHLKQQGEWEPVIKTVVLVAGTLDARLLSLIDPVNDVRVTFTVGFKNAGEMLDWLSSIEHAISTGIDLQAAQKSIHKTRKRTHTGVFFVNDEGEAIAIDTLVTVMLSLSFSIMLTLDKMVIHDKEYYERMIRYTMCDLMSVLETIGEMAL